MKADCHEELISVLLDHENESIDSHKKLHRELYHRYYFGALLQSYHHSMIVDELISRFKEQFNLSLKVQHTFDSQVDREFESMAQEHLERYEREVRESGERVIADMIDRGKAIGDKFQCKFKPDGKPVTYSYSEQIREHVENPIADLIQKKAANLSEDLEDIDRKIANASEEEYCKLPASKPVQYKEVRKSC